MTPTIPHPKIWGRDSPNLSGLTLLEQHKSHHGLWPACIKLLQCESLVGPIKNVGLIRYVGLIR